jgi:serine phosphatase RsbU (regulator of sigma subunit)
VGKSDQDASPFTSQQFTCQKGDILYLFSDGYADQFGGEQGKKLMRKRFKEIIIETASQPMADQKKYLQQFIEDWRQDREQVDDILVMGIQV